MARIRILTHPVLEAAHRLTVELIEDVYASVPWALQDQRGQFTLDRFHGYLTDPRGSYWVAEETTGVVGIALAREGAGVGHLVFLGVSQDHRRHGIASNLLHAVERDFGQRGCHVCELFVIGDDAIARRFYERNGYSVLSTSACMYYSLDATHMMKRMHVM